MPADEIRVKIQGKALWLAPAILVRTRLGLGAAVRQRRDEDLLRALFRQVRAAALARPLLVVTDGLKEYFTVVLIPSGEQHLSRARQRSCLQTPAD